MISRVFRGENESAAVKRKRQIDTLKIFNDNVIELKEDAEYQVEFDAGDRRMAIIVSLSPEFPLEKPILRISPAIMGHPWCNENSEIISAPGLLNFTVHSDLGRVVQAIIREFSKNPPKPFNENVTSNSSHQELKNETLIYGLQHYSDVYNPAAYNLSYYNTQYSKYLTSNSNVQNYNYMDTHGSKDGQTVSASTSYRLMYGIEHHPLPPHSVNSIHNKITVINPLTTVTSTTTKVSDSHARQYFSNHVAAGYNYSTNYNNANMKYSQSMVNQLPVHFIASSEFPELNRLNNEELMKLCEEGDDNIDVFLDECSRLDDIHATIDEIIESVEEMATMNLSKESELKILQDEIALKIETYSALKARYDNSIQQYNKLSEVFTPDHIRECLKRVADESNEQSEKIAENFLEQKIDVERFLSTYIECRKVGQARRTKEEKLAYQLNELKRAGY